MTNQEFHWMIRDAKNVVRGPYRREEICDLLKKNQLKTQTEICQGNSYWFPVEDLREIAKFFPEIGGALVENSPTMTITQFDQSGGADYPEQTVMSELPKNGLFPAADGSSQTPDSEVIKGNSQGEWLNNEFAEDFAEYGTPVILYDENEKTQKNQKIERTEKSEITPTDKAIKRSEALKADTLPSEYLDAEHDVPKPITNYLKTPERGTAFSKSAPAMITVSSNIQEPVPKMLIEEITKEIKSDKSGSRHRIPLLILALAVVAGVVYLDNKENKVQPNVNPKQINKKHFDGTADKVLRKSILLFDLVTTKEALGEMELKLRGQATIGLAQAVFKKEYMYDVDGALVSLVSAKGSQQVGNSSVEIENLSGVYSFDREPIPALVILKRASELLPDDEIFRFNYILGLVRSGNIDSAEKLLSRLTLSTKADPQLEHDIAILYGWLRLATNTKSELTDDAFQKALKVDPFSPKARLGLAISKFKKQNLKEAEAEFRQFLDLVPEIEEHARITSFRKMSNFDFYSFVRDLIRELNVPGGAGGPRPSALVMGVDAVLSCLQNHNGEAGKILESALTIAPGDPQLMKAIAYHRFREGRFDEVVELLKDLPREKNSFSVTLLLGLAYDHLGKKDIEEKFFTQLTINYPGNAKGWSLLGDLFLAKKNNEEAMKNYQVALSKDPFDLRALKGADKLGLDLISTQPLLTTYLPF